MFVCLGATCRSPMASAIFNKVASTKGLNAHAGFCGLNVVYGSAIMPESKQAAKEYGVKRMCGSPRQIAGEDLANSNLVVCLTEDYKIALSRMVADKFVHKIVCFKDICGQDIPDPYKRGQEAYSKCCKLIYDGINKLLESLLAQGLIKEKKKNV